MFKAARSLLSTAELAVLLLALPIAGCDRQEAGSVDRRRPAREEPSRRVETNARFVAGLDLCSVTIARLSNGTLYLAGAQGVRKLDVAGNITDVNIDSHQLARDFNDNVYVSVRGSILKISASGKITTLAGSVAPLTLAEFQAEQDVDGIGQGAHFGPTHSIAADAHGNVYVQSSRMPDAYIRKITSRGSVTTVFKGRVSRDSNNWENSAFAVDSKGNMFLGTRGAVVRIDTHGNADVFAGQESDFLEKSRDGQGRDARFGSYITAMAIDANDNLYVSVHDASIRKISPDGKVTTLAGDPAATQRGAKPIAMGDLVDGDVAGNSVLATAGIDADSEGNVYFVDCFNNAYRKLTPGGMVTTIIRGRLNR